MRERRECKMQNFLSFLMGLIIFQNFEFFWSRENPKHNKFRTFFFVRVETLTSEWYGHLFFWNHFIIYQNCTFKGQLCLAGYAQSSVPGELSLNSKFDIVEYRYEICVQPTFRTYTGRLIRHTWYLVTNISLKTNTLVQNISSNYRILNLLIQVKCKRIKTECSAMRHHAKKNWYIKCIMENFPIK